MIGEILGGKYLVEEEVGQGGMSVVYRGVDTVLKRPVAIKVLHPHLSGRKESRERFEREAQAVATLSHPNILQIFDFSERDDRKSFIVTEFIRGATVRDFIDAHPVEYPELAAMIGVQLCNALEHAHELGIIHRDIKPENVMVCDDGVLKLMDFGIAQIVGAHTMTVTGTLLGSPAHMSPEMIEGSLLDFRADIFSLGTLIYFCATGELPFTGPNPPLVLKAILEGDYTPAEMVNPRVGRSLSRLLDRCLARYAEDRFPSVLELRTALLALLDDVGLARVDDWLGDFFVAPDPLQARLRPHLLEHLERRGREALRDRRVASALEYFNRVLAIEPEHDVVLGLIRRIDRRRKMVVYSVAALLVGLSGVALYFASTLPDPPPRPSVAMVDPALAAQGGAQTDGASLGDAVRAQSVAIAGDITDRRAKVYEAVVEAWVTLASARDVAQIDVDAMPDPQPRNERDAGRVRLRPEPDVGAVADAAGVAEVSAPVQRITLRFKINQPQARVEILGRVYERSQWVRGILVPASTLVRYAVRHPLCQDQLGTVVPDAAGPKVRDVSVTLAWKPAYLVVRDKGGDDAALVTVYDGSTKIATGRVGRRLQVPIVDRLESSRTVRLIVVPSTKGRSLLRLDASVDAGKTTTLPVNL